MSSFDIESVWKRFIIALIGGLVVIGVFYFIIRSAIATDASPNDATNLTAEHSALTSAIPDSNPIIFNSDTNKTASANLPKTQSTEPDHGNGKAKDHLVLVVNRPGGPVLECDINIFPQNDTLVEVRELSVDSTFRFSGLPPSDYDNYYYSQETKFYRAGHLDVRRNFKLTVKNGLISAVGSLTKPILLQFQGSPGLSSILLWPSGCQVELDAQCDEEGNIHLQGGNKILDIFEKIAGPSSNGAVSLALSLPATGSITNIPVSGLQYSFAAVAEAKVLAREKDIELAHQLDVIALFKKLFSVVGAVGGKLNFWQELDQKCQLLTQGRLGLINYDFSGDAIARTSTCQMVLSDLSGSTAIDASRKKIVETTLCESNLFVMAEIADRLAWEKSLISIGTQLAVGRQKLHPAAIPIVVAELRYSNPNQLSLNDLLLGRLVFSAPVVDEPVSRISRNPDPRSSQINRQIAQLNSKIAQLKSQFNPVTSSWDSRNRFDAEIYRLENQIYNLQRQIGQSY